MITQQIIPEDIETTDEIVVAQVVREISCDETCIDSIRKRAQVSDGKVYVSVNGGERFEVTARNPIPIDSNSTSLSFTVVDDKEIRQKSFYLSRALQTQAVHSV